MSLETTKSTELRTSNQGTAHADFSSISSAKLEQFFVKVVLKLK